MSPGLRNEVIIVVGAASGTGLATAKGLLNKGAKVGMSDVNSVALENAVRDSDAEQQGKVYGVANFAGCVLCTYVGTMFSPQGFLKRAVFAASKHASLGMVRNAAMEVDDRARVNCVFGAIDTPTHQGHLARVGKDFPAPTLVGKAQEVADVTILMLSDKDTFVNGAAWSVC
ncbi:hypothetical protein BDP81DRAFT_462573 [Colletotrichum phormii]|uniref:Uncharacterized protein n=1 Tax=Colletotrichum phormii TaxID=359342 RepID=A0AAI9ZPT3_9PEZI|nr:uncharacterized protein BDP81DRAFT_462573 [Colletotrichum phormii]KAK1634818.1 hypothetical protein BDP81DRAFT_462573 [Colletotrichum phormii]